MSARVVRLRYGRVVGLTIAVGVAAAVVQRLLGVPDGLALAVSVALSARSFWRGVSRVSKAMDAIHFESDADRERDGLLADTLRPRVALYLPSPSRPNAALADEGSADGRFVVAARPPIPPKLPG